MPVVGAHLLTDQDRLVRDASEAACVLLDMGRRSLLGKRIGLFVHRDEGHHLIALTASANRSQRSAIPVRLRDRIGRLHSVSLEAVSFDERGILWSARPLAWHGASDPSVLRRAPAHPLSGASAPRDCRAKARPKVTIEAREA